MVKKFFITAFVLLSGLTVSAQTLEKMNWFNEPSQWSITNNKLTMTVTPKSDYWRISHYGFTVEEAPVEFGVYAGECAAKVKVSGDYKARFDQAGMMIRIDHENYIKAGIEFVDGKFNLSTVVTHHTSDWSVITLNKPVDFIWIKAVRRKDAIEIFYSFDDKEYTMMRNAWMEANRPVRVGVMGASPDGNGFDVTFSDFSVKHLPDAVRTEWLEHNKK